MLSTQHAKLSLWAPFSKESIATILIITIAGCSTQNVLTPQDNLDGARKVVLSVEILDQMTKLPGDLGPLPAVPIPLDNPQTPAKIELGKMLFFDKRLSLDKSMSCATCHDPSKGFSDGLPRSIGFGGKELGRHSPTAINAAYNTAQFWDGRAATMEEQAQGPIQSTGEMNLTKEELVKRLNAIPEYKKNFQVIFGVEPSLMNVGKAIAAFERTIVTRDAPFDKYMKGDRSALTLQEKRGLVLFVGKAACSQCHNGPNFTDNQFHSIGAPQAGPLEKDVGRYAVTKDENDREAFKTPSLRNIAQTAPYMHVGGFQTLEEVVDFYNKGGGVTKHKSSKILRLNLTGREKRDLVAFLKSLTGDLPMMSMPPLPKDHS